MHLKLKTTTIILGILCSSTALLTAQRSIAHQRSTTEARIKCEVKGNTCECKVLNDESIITDLAKSKRKDLTPKYFVLWEFDDGNYTIERGFKTVSNTYKTAKTYTVKASFIVQYSDYAIRSQSRSVKILKDGAPTAPPSVFRLIAGLPTDVRTEMRGNDEMTIIADFPKKGNMTIDYDANMTLELPVRGHLGARILANANNKLTFQSDEAQRVFLYFKTTTFSTTQSNKNEKAQIIASFEGKPFTLTFDKVDALDPNKLTVRPRKLRYAKLMKTKENFRYRLQFENEGKENAQKVRLEVDIPQGLSIDENDIKNWTYNCGGFKQKDMPIFHKKFPEGNAANSPFLYLDLEKLDKDKKITFTFYNVDLKGEEFDDEDRRCGEINYQLVPLKSLQHRAFVSDANIFFNENPKPTPASAKTRFKLDPRLGIRGTYELPLKKGEKAIYGLSVFMSNYRPDKIYFPLEIGIAVNERELDSLGNLLKFRPMHLAIQARKNIGNLFAYGIGVEANFATNVRSEKPNLTVFNKGFEYSDLQIFGDIGVLNTRNGGLGFGARGGFPLNPSEKFKIPTKFHAQFYVQYKF